MQFCEKLPIDGLPYISISFSTSLSSLNIKTFLVMSFRLRSLGSYTKPCSQTTEGQNSAMITFGYWKLPSSLFLHIWLNSADLCNKTIWHSSWSSYLQYHKTYILVSYLSRIVRTRPMHLTAFRVNIWGYFVPTLINRVKYIISNAISPIPWDLHISVISFWYCPDKANAPKHI